MKINLKISFLFLLLIGAFCANGQLCYQKGYVVTLEKDTICGLIKDRGEIGNAKMCQFKVDRKGKSINYSPSEIKSYCFINGKHYRSLEVMHKEKYQTAFAEVLLEGKVNLYHFWRESDMCYFIEKEDGKIVGLLSEFYTLEEPSDSWNVPSKFYDFNVEIYKDTLESVFKDCKEMKKKISEVDYETKPLMQVTKDYLNCTCKQDACIRYEKNLNLAKPTIGFFTGVQLSRIDFLSSNIQSNILTSTPVGVFVNAPMPMLNERLSFQAEFIYNRLNYNQGFINLPWIYTDINISSTKLGVPLSLRYKLSGKKLSPSIGVGKEFALIINSAVNTVPVENGLLDYEKEYRQRGFFLHNFQKEGWFFDLGIDYSVTPKFSIYSNLRVESYLNLIIEEQNYSNYKYSIAEQKNRLNSPHSNIYRTNTATLFLGIRF